jgi:hypothetical protein
MKTNRHFQVIWTIKDPKQNFCECSQGLNHLQILLFDLHISFISVHPIRDSLKLWESCENLFFIGANFQDEK